MFPKFTQVANDVQARFLINVGKNSDEETSIKLNRFPAFGGMTKNSLIMKRKEFKTRINAPKEKVWKVLWDDETYGKWTAAFFEGSRAETDWQEGSKVQFLDPDGNGMLSKIKKSQPCDKMYFEHSGVVHAGVEDTGSEEAKKWKGLVENYTLTKNEGGTELLIETDIPEAYLKMFEKAWPMALERVKELSEVNKIS